MFRTLMSVIRQKKRTKQENQQETAKLNAVNQIADEEKIKTEKLKEFKKKEGKLTNEITAVQQLLLAGNSKLTDALKKKDNAQVVVAQAMLSIASSKLSITQMELTNIIAELHNIKRPAEHGSVDQRSKKQTVNTTENSSRESATCVLSKSKIPAAAESSKLSTKRPAAINRWDGTVPAA